MKIITILLLMITHQILAENITVSIDDGEYKEALGIGTTAPGGRTVEHCNQIANISKRTIKAAISGVPKAEVINKFTDGDWTHNKGVKVIRGDGNVGIGSLMADGTDGYYNDPWLVTNKITAIYKAVNQIKMKHSQVREQDRVRLNNRVEQQLIRCCDFVGGGTAIAVCDRGKDY